MKDEIVKIICDVKEDMLLKDKISESNDLLNDIAIDSLELINIVLRVEDEFDIEIDFEEFDMNLLRSVNSLVQYISLQKGVVI